jgi:hypothetical protein
VAEIFIDRDTITLRLEIGDGDRKAFAALLDPKAAASSRGDTPQAAHLEHFFHAGFVLRGDDGRPLLGEVKVVERRQRVSRPTPFQPTPEQEQASARVTYVEILYPLPEPPETLTLTPTLQMDGDPAVDIGFIVYHQSIPVIDFHYLQGHETLRLDWTDPWYSAFDNPTLKRHHRAPLMTFLYIEPYAVRFEILMRLKELASWITLNVPNDQQITANKQPRLLQQIGQFFLAHSHVRINGEHRRPGLDRVQFVEMTRQGIQPLAAPEQLTLHTAIIGVILAYVTDGPPQEVTIDWQLFNHNITSVPASIIDPVSTLPYDLTPDQPVLTWTNMLANYAYDMASIDAIAVHDPTRQVYLPLPSLLLLLTAVLLYGCGRLSARQDRRPKYRLGAGTLLVVLSIVLWPYGRITLDNPFVKPSILPQEKAQSIITGLLRNTYRAFDFRREEDVYDKLAVSVTGDLISDIYLQHRSALELEDQGGARASVQDVALLNLRQIGPPGNDLRLTFQCTWLVAGSVGHWGHTHFRRNQYEALLTIKPVDNTWKILALDLTDERRLP